MEHRHCTAGTEVSYLYSIYKYCTSATGSNDILGEKGSAEKNIPLVIFTVLVNTVVQDKCSANSMSTSVRVPYLLLSTSTS